MIKESCNKLIIFLYHGIVRAPLQVDDLCFVDESSFRNQIMYINEHFEVLPLIDAVERLKKGKIYRPTAAITFDDGFQNNYDFAYPFLREEELPATLFLTTGLLNSHETHWYCRVNHALSNTSKNSIEWNGTRFDFNDSRSKAISSSLIQKKLKDFPQLKLLIELRRILIALGYDPECPIEVGSPYRMLNYQSIKDMASSGLIEFGAHTHSHPILSLISSKERFDEIASSIRAVTELTGRPCKIFAYPNGLLRDYDKEVIRILKSCGIRLSVTAINGLNDETTPSMELRRFGIGADLSVGRFKQKLHSITTSGFPAINHQLNTTCLRGRIAYG